MKTKRAYLTKPGHFEIKESDISVKSDQILVKIAVCGLCNWELNHWKGLIGECPLIPGHEWAGVVVEVGADVTAFKAGDKVTGLPDDLGAFSEYLAVNHKSCFKLKEQVNIEEALGEPLKCIVTVIRATEAQTGDHGVVLGCGPMGLWSIQALAGKFLSSIIAIDVDDEKLEMAKKYGATHTINPKHTDVEKALSEITAGRMADFVIEGTGIPALLNGAMKYLKPTGRGRLILMSSHEDSCKDFDFREAIGRGIEIVAAHPSYSANQSEDLERAVSLINSGTFNSKDIISHKFSLEDINKAFETLEHKPKDYIKGIVVM